MPYDPLAQAELEQQRAEQNSASPNASPEDQQEAAERAVRKQQAYESSPSHQASLANAATREAEKAQRTAQEAAYRSQGIPTWTGADGNLYPDTHKLSEQAAKEQEKTAKEQAKAAKDATDLAARQQRADAIRSGRRHQVNPVDKTPIYLESEEQLQARRAAEAEKLRRSHIEEQIRATEAEHGALFAQHAAEGIKPLPATARKALTEKGLAKAKQDALYALQSQYQEQAKATDKGGWWDVVNNNPTPEATAAQQHLARLSAPDAELTEEDLALLSQNEATKPIVQKIQNIQGRLSKDDELQKLKAEHDLRVAELKLRRDAPDKWAESVRARRAQMTPEQLQAELEASNADLDTRAASLQQKATALNEQVAAHTQQLEALAQQAAQRREQGIPAGEVVTYQGPDGTLENWPQDLASQREAIAARLQDTEAQQATDWAALKMQEQELKMEASLHNEASQLLQTTQTAKTEEAKKSDLSRLQYTPGHEQTAQELAALDAESQSRLTALQEQYQGQPPPEALAALQQDIAQRSQSALAMGDSRRLAAQSAYAGIQQQLQEYQANPEKKGDVGDLWINARKNLAEALQIPEAQAMQLLEDVEAEQDWDKVLGRFQEATPSGEWKSWRNALSDDSDPRLTRVLSNGGIVVNPSITDEAKYKAAVESAKASPEAKAAALARYPEIRQRQGQNVLDTLKEIEGTLSTFGADTLKDWEAYAKKRPQDVSEQDWALKFSEKLKADTAASPWSALLKQVSRSGVQGVYDLRQQSSGFIAGITGSESAMQDAQWAGRKAEAIGATKELEGTVGHNFITRGLLDQLPRLAGSILPAAGGAKLAQGGIKLFAATSLGGRLLPSLSAALKSAATPAQAVKAVQTLTRVGLGGTAAAAGVQTYGSQLADIYGTLRREDPSLTHQQALSAAQQPALLSAAVTALLTTAGGAHGLEKLLVNPTAARELFKKQFTSQLQRAGFLGAAFAKGAGKELPEELPDELFSQYQAAVASHPKDPQAGTKAIAEFMKQLPELSVAIGVMGGAGEAISDAQGTSVTNGQPSATTVNLPETQAAAEAAIQNHRHLDANGVEIPEFTQATQQRAALALATARGGDLFDATEKQLNAAGWTRRDSQGRDMPPGKYARLKDYTGPNVLNIDTEGRAHIDPAYLTSLKENLPAVAAAIPEEASRPSTPATSEPGTKNQEPTASQPGTTPAGQTPAHGAGANANQNPVPAPDQPGAQPPSSGGASAQSGTPVTASDVATPGRTSSPTAVPTVEKSIADWLVDRHMPDAEAAAAAKAITSHPDMAGKDYDHFTRQITARDSLLKSLGITGSTTKSQSSQNPLRFRSDAGTPARTSGSGSETPPTKNQEPGTNNSPSLPPAVQAALDDTIPGTPSQEVFEAVKKAVQAKEMTEQQATEIVAQQSGALDHTELRQSLENKLGWNTTRANTAAALHFGDKTKSSIPLAAAERAASGSGPSTAVGPDPELASAPSTLTQNDDYGRAKLSALSRIKDPAKKAWTRQFLSAFEKSFERHHLLYDAIATGAAARKRLDGQFTAVMSIGGKITRLIDLDSMVGQFSHIESPAAALRATGIEEDVHAMVLQLSRKTPGKYGYPALVKKWKELPAKLKQSVWQAYRAANQNTAHANESKMPVLTQEQEWHMMNEFLRMLVQDKHFAGQITEAVDASPTLIQWVKDLLKDLGNILRGLLKDAPPALQKDIKSMVAEIGQRLKDIEGKSSTTTARLETIPTLADTQGVTSQALTTLLKDGQGILSPDALARIWDQLDPALQKRVFTQKDRTPRQTTLLKLPYTAATRAPKHELMQELLTLLITDPDAAQSLLSIPKSTNLLNKLVSSLRDAIVPPSARPSPAATTSALLATLHAQTLRLLGSITGARFVQSLPPPVTETVTTVTPAVAAKILAARSATSTDSPVSGSDSVIPLPAIPLPKNSGTESPSPEPLHPRAADFLAAIEAAETALERDHTDAANDESQAKLRAKLRLQEVAATRTRFFLRDNAAREQHQATQAGRQDVEKATALQDLALGRIGARRPASAWRTLGMAERRRLALLGIGVDQHPSTDTGGYPYSLSRIESAEARVEFSLAGTPENQLAQEELDWMRQQPAEYQTALDPLSPAYVERDHLIIKQSALDDLALSYPHTTALIRPEWQTRQSYGLRTDARLAQVKQALLPAPAEERPANTEQPELPTSNPPGSGSVQPPSTSANNRQPPPTTALAFPIPLSKRGLVRRSTFPDADSLAAFQFKLDADTASAARSTATEVKKAEGRALNLLARLMEDSPLSRSDLESRLLDYHRTVVQLAEAASAFGTFTPPAFHAFTSNGGIPTPSGNLPAPEGGDILSAMRAQGIRRLGPPDASDGWSWYRALQQDAASSKLKNPESQRLARAGDLTDAKARLFWINEHVVSLTGGRSIDEAATELSESEDQQFPVNSGDELGQAILEALDARIRAAASPSTDLEEQASKARASTEDFATYAAGTPGQPFTAAELSQELQPEDEIQIGSEYLTVIDADPAARQITLDSSRFGPVTATGDQTLHLTSGPNHLRIRSDAGSPARSSDSGNPVQTQSTESLAALRNALPPGTQRDILKPSPVESTLKDGTLPAATSEDTAALDRDFYESVAAGNALDASAPSVADLDLEDDIADEADAYLDGESLAAAQRLPSNGGIPAPSASPFYSALARAIESKMPARSTPATVIGILKNTGIKTEELKWTGILPWLQQQAQNGPITQQQVLDYLKTEGAVHLQEVRLGGSQTSLEDANRAVIAQAQSEGMTKSGAEDYALSAARGELSPGQQSLITPAMRPLVDRLRASYEARAAEYAAGQSQPKYSQYQLPGGTNYREVILALPSPHTPTFEEFLQSTGKSQEQIDAMSMRDIESLDEQWRDKVREIKTSAGKIYESSHFSVPNYVAHMRLNDRTDATGQPGTFIEEIQSDRHQAGREHGYQNPAQKERMSELVEEEKRISDRMIALRRNGTFETTAKQEYASLLNQARVNTHQIIALNAEGGIEGIPDAPFRTSWPLQMFKRALVDAVASGKQWIGWTTGETQAERYDLSQHIDTISYAKTGEDKYTLSASKDNISAFEEEGASIQRIAEVLGKEIAKKIEAGEGQFEPEDEILDIPAHHKLSGVDLKVGGEGMKGFYDTILPKEIGKYVKQWGAGVQKGQLPGGKPFQFKSIIEFRDALHGDSGIDDELQRLYDDYQKQETTDSVPIWRVDITPQMRAGVEAGQALFASQRQRFDLSRALAPTTTQSGALSSLFNPRPSAPPAATSRSGYFPSTATPELITQAYTAAAKGQSSAMLPIRRVFEHAQAIQPSLTPAAFLRALKAADDSGQVLLEPYDTPAQLEASQPFVLRNASGIPSVSMAVAAALPAAQRVAAAAAETDRNPSAAQKTAGNYAKGKVTLHGLRLSIENPRGSVRSGTDASGKPWSVTMPHHYGYFLGTESKDGDHVDFFLGPNPESQQVLIINQRKPSNGHFDEHKIMLGFDSPAQAARAYMASYTPGWKGLQSAVPTTIPVLKEWLANHDTTKPVTRESLAKIAASLPAAAEGILRSLTQESEGLALPASTRTQTAESVGRALFPTLIGAGLGSAIAGPIGAVAGIAAANALSLKGGQITSAAGTATQKGFSASEKIMEFTGLQRPFASLGSAPLDTRLAKAIGRLTDHRIDSAKAAAEAWLNKPEGISPKARALVDQALPNALVPREWLALSHEMQRKTAFGAELSNDLIRALDAKNKPRVSDLSYPPQFISDPRHRQQLFDAMEGKLPWDSLPPEMQALGTKLRAMLRETGLELVKQVLMHPDTFEELQANGWMPRYTEDDAKALGGSFLASFKLGIQDLRQQRSTAFHIVDTTRRGPDGQYLTVNQNTGGRSRWRFRDAATRDAFYSDFIRRQALDMLQETHGNTKEVQTMMATLDGQQRREIRAQIKLLTRADMDSTQKLSPALAGMVKAAIEHQKSIYKKENPFDPPKLIKDPVYAVSRYILAQTHNAATMELLNKTAANPDWVSTTDVQGFKSIPDNSRFGPLAGKYVRTDIASQLLDLVNTPSAAMQMYDGILRRWKSAKLVWNPGSHLRDAVGNSLFAHLSGNSIWNPANSGHYKQAITLLRGGTIQVGKVSLNYSDLIQHAVLGGDAYSSLVKDRLRGLLPDARTLEANPDPSFLASVGMGFGAKFHASNAALSELRRFPDDFYKTAGFIQRLQQLQEENPSTSTEGLYTQAAAHVRKWFPYYDRLGQSGLTRFTSRVANPFLSFLRESTRIGLVAFKERPIAFFNCLAFTSALSFLSASAIFLALSDHDKDEVDKDLTGKSKFGFPSWHPFSMLLPVRNAAGQLQQLDISAIMPFADLLGQKIVPLEEKENNLQTFIRGMISAGPLLGSAWALGTNRDSFTGRHIVENDMSTLEMAKHQLGHIAATMLPPLAPDVAAGYGVGEGGPLSKLGERSVNKTLQTYDATQTVIRSIFGMNVKSAAPNIYRQADDFRKAHGYDAQPDFDYGTTATSRAKRALVQQLAQDNPNPVAIKNLVKRLKEMGVPLDTPGAITKVLKIIDPASIIGGSKKLGLSAADARQRFRQSLPPESRTLYEASLREYQRITQRAPSLLRAAQ